MYYNIANDCLAVSILVYVTVCYYPIASIHLGHSALTRPLDLDGPFRLADIFPFQELDTKELVDNFILGLRIPCPAYRTSNIIFALYTRERKDQPCYLTPNSNDTNAALRECNFKNDKKTVVLIHGYRSIGISFFADTKNAYLQVSDMNVLIVDWSFYAACYYNQIFYEIQMPLAVDIYEVVKVMLDSGVSIKNVHLVGHSMGANIAGMVGKLASNSTYGKFARITGLDTAQHLYDESPDSFRLIYTDADFVDAIHTSVNRTPIVWGTSRDVGHADFWPNGGYSQTLLRLGQLYIDGFISHIRSVSYFTESITNKDDFCSTRCISYKAYTDGKCDHNQKLHMGEYAEKPKVRGNYYLKTHFSPPYGLPCEEESNSSNLKRLLTR